MTIVITDEIVAAYGEFLNAQVDAYVGGQPILRRDTYPYTIQGHSTLVDFAAGFQAGQGLAQKP